MDPEDPMDSIHFTAQCIAFVLMVLAFGTLFFLFSGN